MLPAPTTSYPPGDSSGVHRVIAAVEQKLYPVAGRVAAWFAAASALLCGLGLFLGFFVLAGDSGQGGYDRILLIHVPAGWMALAIYVVMTAAAGGGAMLDHRLFSMVASALAPTGAMFAFLALWTGALWGKPHWGEWWVWDPRLVAILLLLVLFMGFVALQAAMEDSRRADTAGAVLSLIGMAGLPIVYLAAEYWGEGQYGASLALSLTAGPLQSQLAGMVVMAAGLAAYTVAAALTRLRTLILERERRSEWVARLAGD